MLMLTDLCLAKFTNNSLIEGHDGRTEAFCLVYGLRAGKNGGSFALGSWGLGVGFIWPCSRSLLERGCSLLMRRW